MGSANGLRSSLKKTSFTAGRTTLASTPNHRISACWIGLDTHMYAENPKSRQVSPGVRPWNT